MWPDLFKLSSEQQIVGNTKINYFEKIGAVGLTLLGLTLGLTGGRQVSRQMD